MTADAATGHDRAASADAPDLTPGQLAVLGAVAAGRAEITCSCEPDLYVDGVPFCNQWVAHELARAGHLRPARPGRIGQRVAAALTDRGWRAVATPTTSVKEAA
jgi:hypothetical protein